MFCPRCGAEQAERARFCERCGERLDLDDPPMPTVAATPVPVVRRRATRDPRLIAGAVAIALVAVAVAVIALTGVLRSDDSGERAATPASTPVPSSPTTTAPPAATPTQAPESETNAEEPVSPPARATVKRTCGRNGVGGDCQLSVRARPSTTAAELKRLDEGDALRLTCQVRGDSVFSSALGDSSTVWSRTSDGGYVANVYLAGPRLSTRRITLRRC
jgi:hypothetical protein